MSGPDWQVGRVLPPPPGVVCDLPPGTELWVEPGKRRLPTGYMTDTERSSVYDTAAMQTPERSPFYYPTAYVTGDGRHIWMPAFLVELLARPPERGDGPSQDFAEHVPLREWRP